MDLKIFQYRNLFPAGVSQPDQFLLCVMGILKFPLHDGTVRRILKPVLCDELAPRLLRKLVEEGYLAYRHTGQGTFYAVTAKTLAFLDYNGQHKPHRTAKIADAALLTNQLKGEIAAREIVRLASAVYAEAWDALSPAERSNYITEKGLDARLLEKAIAGRGVACIDALPRTLVSHKAIVKTVADGIAQGCVPFTPAFQSALCASAPHSFLHAMGDYEEAIHRKMQLAAQRKSPTHPSQARRYLDLTRELAKVNAQIEDIKSQCTLLTYRCGEKILCPSVLESNGIFIRSIGNGDICIGILNNAPAGLPVGTLIRRLDIAVSLADILNLHPTIYIYTLPEHKDMTCRRLALSLDKLALPDLPEILFCQVFDKHPKPKHITMSTIK